MQKVYNIGKLTQEIKMTEPDVVELDIVYVDIDDEDWGKSDSQDDYEDEVDWDD